MENIKIKKSKGRPAYQEDIKQLKELFLQIANKTITNEERLEDSRLWKDKMVSIKEII